MNKRPRSVTVLSWVFVATGVVGLISSLTEFQAAHPFPYDLAGICLIRFTALVCGVYLLRRCNWARWLTLAWTASHVILSGFHSLRELVIHSLLFAVVAYILCRPQTAAVFSNWEPRGDISTSVRPAQSNGALGERRSLSRPCSTRRLATRITPTVLVLRTTAQLTAPPYLRYSPRPSPLDPDRS